jgi:hypothetical protein
MACPYCKEIKEIIEAIDNRCLAADGPVTPTHLEITTDELRRIYKLSRGCGLPRLKSQRRPRHKRRAA